VRTFGVGLGTMRSLMDCIAYVVNRSLDDVGGFVDGIFFHDAVFVPDMPSLKSDLVSLNLGKEASMAGLANLIWTLIVILVVLWLLGFLLHVGGALIHLLLVVAVVLLIINLLTGRGARV